MQMAKVFLSHSSEDKEWYVNIVYKKLVKALGEDSVVIDNVVFQEGRKTIEEIYYQLGVTDLFVIFLSDKALASQWVQDELKKVEGIAEEKKRYQICPIIIDTIVKYDDDRIPTWMRQEYNIQRICSQTKASNVIRQRMIEISYEKHPKLKERDLLFVGRNEYLRNFEERMDDFDKETPVAIIASGLEGIGRRTFLKHSLYKSNIVKETFPFSYIVLRSDESIEDCILKLYDLGFITDVEITIELVASMDMKSKVSLLRDIIVQLQKSRELVFVIDNGCIVNHEGEMAEWFDDAIQDLDVESKITFLLVCKFRYFVKGLKSERVYDIALPELDIKERNGLLKRYLELENVNLDTKNTKIVSDLLTGLPEQVFFAVSMIKNQGWQYFYNNINDVTYFSNRKAAIMLQDVRENEELMEFLALIGSFDYISISYLMSIVSDSFKYMHYIDELYYRGICEYVGVLREYIRVNDTIRDYLQRSEYKISKAHEKRLKENVHDFVNNIDDRDYDVPELLHSLKTSLIEGIDIDNKYIIPSIYLKIMNDLYNSGKNNEVVQFADKALQGSSFMDQRIIFEVRYLLCSALAKLRKDRFKDEVMKIEGADHEFLFGFYYRQIGRFDKALERINNSLSLRENFSKAKREKVQIYIGMQDYESALELARLNYENYKDNPYHIQAYFTCVIKSDNVDNKKKILQELIGNMKSIGSKISEELTLRFKAQYAAFMENDYDVAIGYINQAIEMNENIHYARLVKFDIAEKFGDIKTMQDIADYFKKVELRQRYNDNIVCMDSLIKAKKGDCIGAIEYFKMHIKNYTDEAKDRFIIRLNKYAS